MRTRRIEIDGGDLNQRVTFKRRDVSQVNEMNEPIDGETVLCERWARIEPVSGREYFAAQENQGLVSHRVNVWSDSQTRLIKPEDWISWGRRRLNIVRVTDDSSAKTLMTLDCREVV